MAFPSPEDLPDPGVKPTSPALAGRSFTTEPPGKLPAFSIPAPKCLNQPSVLFHSLTCVHIGHHLDAQPLWGLLTFVIPAVPGSTTLSSSSPRPPSLALAFKLLEAYSNLSPAFSPSTFTSSWNYPTLCLLCSHTQAAVLCGGSDSMVQVGTATASLPPPSADPCGPWQSFPWPSLSDSPSPTVDLRLSPVSSHLLLSPPASSF